MLQILTKITPSYGATIFYDGATYRGTLRTFGVVNPISYLFLSRFISEQWSEISKTFRLSRFSGSRPKFPPLNEGGRAISVASLSSQRVAQRHLASSYPVILNLDINRFYGSIYTHSIPWAVLGKEEAKKRFANGQLRRHWSNVLDQLVRNGNQQQTIGIPIGPDTSRILSELLLARIDRELTATRSGLMSSQIFHNIDDYQFGVLSQSDAEDAQSVFVRTIARYELRLNDFKTSIDQGIEFSPSHFQREFDILRQQSGRNLIEHFFHILYDQVGKNPNSNVVGYTLKRFAPMLVSNPEQSLLREYLQRLILASPHQARWIFPILLGIVTRAGADSDIRRIIQWGLDTCARRNDVGSLVWFLYAAIFLNIRIGSTLCSKCIGISNELVDVMLCHGRSLGHFSFPLSRMHQRYRNADLSSSSWLPLYEVERRGWDNSAAFQKLSTNSDLDGYYQTLRQNNVEFYVTDQNLFTVSAFEGWGLTQRDFEPQRIHNFDWNEIDFGAVDENYE